MAREAENARKKTRILVVGKENLFRTALAIALDLEPDFVLIGQTEDLKGPHGRIDLSGADVIIADRISPFDYRTTLPEFLTNTRTLPKIIMLCDSKPVEITSGPASLGQATHFLLREIEFERLKEFIRNLNLDRQFWTQINNEVYRHNYNPLTKRECQALKYAEEGLSTIEISQRMTLSYGTTRNYLSDAIQKTQAKNRFEAARRARSNGWI